MLGLLLTLGDGGGGRARLEGPVAVGQGGRGHGRALHGLARVDAEGQHELVHPVVHLHLRAGGHEQAPLGRVDGDAPDGGGAAAGLHAVRGHDLQHALVAALQAQLALELAVLEREVLQARGREHEVARLPVLAAERARARALLEQHARAQDLAVAHAASCLSCLSYLLAAACAELPGVGRIESDTE
ncbi:hypothetical protein ON010_g12329 [Phytophthora cinnamomi]|nr:hypothetical protein ON010_g12329 [Phytophthora cinnamomi]